jgi:hypothetical protein
MFGHEKPQYLRRRGARPRGSFPPDEAWVKARLADRASRIPVWRSRSLVIEGEMPSTVLLDAHDGLLSQLDAVVFLGLMDDVAYFALDVSDHEEPPFREHGEFHDLRQVGRAWRRATAACWPMRGR